VGTLVDHTALELRKRSRHLKHTTTPAGRLMQVNAAGFQYLDGDVCGPVWGIIKVARGVSDCRRLERAMTRRAKSFVEGSVQNLSHFDLG
jgi:hypothetical protein